ncbi:MAG TPA: hypothetical protein VK821_15435 [Dehalococcoidia bacterium]|nr:hypothetical protein [Dehalococcoidia bacterium]
MPREPGYDSVALGLWLDMLAMYKPWPESLILIRKQFYIQEKQQRKLRELAAQWQCTEAEVVRTALERLSDPGDAVDEALRRAGLLQEEPEDPNLPDPEEIAGLEEDLRAWTRTRKEPLGLSEAVLEDRR